MTPAEKWEADYEESRKHIGKTKEHNAELTKQIQITN